MFYLKYIFSKPGPL